ncbi:recombinase family protein [Streptomyces abikoensis]|uniref:recombinase family protein n=1 Tax=Streptomyces abikoensis TaxID=97398 RepID=UPI003404A268
MAATKQVSADRKPLRSSEGMTLPSQTSAGGRSTRSKTSVDTETQTGPAGQPTHQTPGMETLARLRGVRAVRLSVLTDETTSPERQREADDLAAAALGIDFDGREAVDLDVSASKVGPFDRPELGAWLARPDEFDAIVWWRFDRAIRSMSDMHDLAKWAKQHRKMLVFAEGIGGGRLVFDFRNAMDPTAELMMMMLAFAAQVESASIRDRVLGAHAAMRKMAYRWKGGRPSYGYMIAPMPKEHGAGKTLVPDPDAVKVIERIIRDLLSGMTITKLCQDLRAEKVPTPRDHWSLKAGRKTGGKTGGAKGETTTRDAFCWVPSVIRKVLTSPALLGWKLHQGNPVRDSEGTPIMATEHPILTREEFDVIGKLFEDRKIGPHDRVDQKSKLLRVIHCAGCGSRMYHMSNKRKGVQRESYKCTAHLTGIVCPASVAIRADWVEEYVEREFLALIGDLQTQKTIVIPGYDPAPEIAATLAEFNAHQEEKGRQKSTAAKRAWQERADALDNRLAVLEQTPARPEKREVVTTGRTIREVWAESDDQERRHLLLEAGARLLIKKGTRGGWRKLDESRVSFALGEGFFRDAADALVALREELAYESRPDVPSSGGGGLRLAA